MSEQPVKSPVGAMNLSEVSHHDLAWVEGSFDAETKYVNNEISVALDSMNASKETKWSHELAIFVHEFLKAHPERYEELRRRLMEGRFEIGAGYSSPYTSAIPAEALARQFIYGKKWVDDTFPGYHADVFYNTDIPGLTPQMPQILKKSEVNYLYASRSWNFPGYDHTEMKKWASPDGTAVKTLFLNHYGNAWGRCGGDINNDEYLVQQVHNFEKHLKNQKLGNRMPLVYSSDSIVSIDFTERISSWNAYAEENGLPKMVYSTVLNALEEVFAADADFTNDTLAGEWPNTWFYESNPADYEAYKQHKIAERLLRAAETLSVLQCILTGNFDTYPADTIRQAWMALEMVCHGYAPKGAIEDFEASYRKAYELAKPLYDEKLQWLVSQVDARQAGMPLVVYNNLSYPRTDLVLAEKPQSLSDAFHLVDAKGQEVPCQLTSDGKLLFVAASVPSFGYATYYLVEGCGVCQAAKNEAWTQAYENEFYRITPGRNGTLASVLDKQTGRELFDCSKFSIGQMLVFQYDGMGAGEHLNIWQPHSPKEVQLQKDWTCVEAGPVRTVFEASVSQGAGTAVLQIMVYAALKKIDFHIRLNGFGEVDKNQVRLMFPVAMGSMFGQDHCADNSQVKVSYEVPFGTSVVGDEVLPLFSRFNDNTGDPNDVGGDVSPLENYTKITGVRPRNVQNWIRAEDKDFFVNISSFNLGWDYQDATADPVQTPVLQPVLLSVSKSCHGGYGHWVQPGEHEYVLSLTSGTPDQAPESGRAAISVNNPLDARVQTVKAAEAALPECYSAFSADSDKILIDAVKLAEDDCKKVVFRCHDLQGQGAKQVTVRLPAGTFVAKAEGVNLIEHKTGVTYAAAENRVTLDVAPWSIETAMLSLVNP